MLFNSMDQFQPDLNPGNRAEFQNETSVAGSLQANLFQTQVLELTQRRSRTMASPSIERGVGCIHHLFEAQAASRPDAVALTFEGWNMTYAELNTRANQVAW